MFTKTLQQLSVMVGCASTNLPVSLNDDLHPDFNVSYDDTKLVYF
jgi:hypothetical protein